VERDIVAHYAGWLFYRDSPWIFPIGVASNLGYPVGTVISFTDSIPIIAILCKTASGLLPVTFQYFGVYIFLCFILQGISSSLLIALFTQKRTIIIFGSLLFCLSPIMIERAFRHAALASHYLIIFALYLYFNSRKSEQPKFQWKFIVLNVLAIGIHPYFLPMVFGITFIAYLEQIIKFKKIVRQSCLLVCNILSILLFGYILGIFGLGGGSSLGGWGFGHFSMNLNAIINPVSAGGIIWSAILKTQPQILGNYDGFNYLGIGVLLGIFIVAVNFALDFTEKKLAFNRNAIGLFLRRNICLLILCVILALFAVSNVVTYNDSVLFTYSLPTFILNLCAVFRASSRMFYVVYYLIFLTLILLVLSRFSGRKANSLLVMLLIIQILDISPALVNKHKYFNEYSQNTDATYEFADFDKLLSQYKYFISEGVLGFRNVAQLGKNHMITNIDISNRNAGNKEEISKFRNKRINDLISGNLDLQTIYAFADKDIWSVMYANNENNVYPVEVNDMFLLVPKTERLNISESLISIPHKAELTFASLTDDNWENGIWRDENVAILLIENAEYKNFYIEKANFIKTGEFKLPIEAVEEKGYYTWVYVNVDDRQELLKFAHPNKVEFVGAPPNSNL
jgi:hypothetical protein